MEQPSATEKKWSFFKKVTFLYLFMYGVLYFFPFPVYVLSFLTKITGYYTTVWNKLIVWFGKEILGITYEISTRPNGSGDTTSSYIQVLLLIIISLLVALIWGFLDRKRKNYRKLMQWGMVYIRYALIYVLFSYGIVKVIKLQFRSPGLLRLLEPLGDFSPMGLAWTYMGYSDTYTIFAGACEILAAVLLIFRRTKTLGALVGIGVMLNIFMMNMSYDIPVKLYSFHLMAFALIISLQDYKRLLNLFFLNKPTKTVESFKLFKNSKWNKVALALKIVFLGYMFYSGTSSSIENSYQYGTRAPKPVMYGIYDVEDFVINSDTLPPLLTDSIRWRRIIFNFSERATIKKMNDERTNHWFALSLDTLDQKMEFASFGKEKDTINFNYQKIDSITYVLKGIRYSSTNKQDTLTIKMKRFDETQFRLLSRGFNWINEFPFNR